MKVDITKLKLVPERKYNSCSGCVFYIKNKECPDWVDCGSHFIIVLADD